MATGLSAATYVRRRKQLMRQVGDDGIVIVPSAPERIRSRDTHYPYRPDSDLWYLSGFAEPRAVLVLIPGRMHGESILFCRERDPEREGWDGARVGPEGAVHSLGFDDAYPIDDLDDILPGLLEGRSCVHYPLGRDTEFDLQLIGWLNRTRARGHRGTQSPNEFIELGHLLDEMRLFKSAEELRVMQRAVDISIEAHRHAMRAAKPGIAEYELQAEVERVFRRHDACPAYGSIVGAGANACVLHYIDNNAKSGKNDLILIDAGAEYRGYAADITRTFPVSGRFSAEQRALHDLVGAAQRAALAQAQPGRPWSAMHDAAIETLTDGLLGLGLLKGTLKQHLKDESHKRFTRHKTGHWLGLDVHDVGEYRIDGESRLLEPGMAFTVEPGLYVGHDERTVPTKWRGIGIRTEDDVVVTANGHRILSETLVRDVDAIEAFMADGL
ncbi:Xaa-Pro aminopeptidase [Lysobacter silvestris]|uniref:Xaa-Pro aminopeptidase n=1 Tax=Solilutibacter silvestris TaxID=1645665 RepID=A0A2K1Q1Y8_9GAMM|nr:Xaa-Pro aminopeptidase [Lysobacter silvestris]